MLTTWIRMQIAEWLYELSDAFDRLGAWVDPSPVDPYAKPIGDGIWREGE